MMMLPELGIQRNQIVLVVKNVENQKIFKKKDIKTYVTLTVNRQTQYAFRLKKFGLNCYVVLTFSKK